MAGNTPQPPQFSQPNMEPTLNGKGFMFKVLDDFARDFIAYAGSCPDPVLDVGCAYGAASLPALAGGATVVACDMEPQHLEILASRADEADRSRLETVAGALPGVDFSDDRFGAIFCSRVLHFLSGEDVQASVDRMYRWLKPGGRLYLVADTPYGIWRKFIPEFEAAKARGDRWPGIMRGLENYLPMVPKDRPIDGPPFMNLLDPELLARTCEEAGFTIHRAEWINRDDFSGQGRMDGRENAGVMALKPA